MFECRLDTFSTLILVESSFIRLFLYECWDNWCKADIKIKSRIVVVRCKKKRKSSCWAKTSHWHASKSIHIRRSLCRHKKIKIKWINKSWVVTSQTLSIDISRRGEELSLVRIIERLDLFSFSFSNKYRELNLLLI